MQHHLPGRRATRARALARSLVTPPLAATAAAATSLVQVLLCVGAAHALVTSALPDQPDALVTALGASALGMLGLAVAVRCRGRLGTAWLHVVLVVVSLLVSATALVAADTHASTAFMLWYGVVVAVAVATSSWVGVGAHVALAVASATFLHVSHGVGTPTTVVVVSTALVLTAFVTGRGVRGAGDADVDVLTRLASRRGFERQVSTALGVANARANTGADAPLTSVLLLDLDGFAAVNRSLGQDGGDAVLRTVAGQLRAALPPHTPCARLGGDRFAVLLSRHDEDVAPGVAQELQRAIAPLEASIGAAQAESEEDGSSLLRRAEVALHAAKGAGRNCLRTAGAHDEQLLRGLRRALAGRAVQVALQPLVDPASHELVGVEALARWHHPARGWVSPGVFIPVAEQNGLIVELGQAVLERACTDASRLRQHLGRPLTLTVNASGVELVRPEYVDVVAEVLHRTRWSPQDLVIEVTESNLEAASVDTLSTVERLRELGVRIAIDDFGTGYSAFSQLDTLPAQFLKLDTSFTAATTTSPRRRAMLTALVTLSGDLGLQVIAEGVETAEQAELVARFGCDLAQGYHYSRPMLVADLIAELERRGALQDRSAGTGGAQDTRLAL